MSDPVDELRSAVADHDDYPTGEKEFAVITAARNLIRAIDQQPEAESPLTAAEREGTQMNRYTPLSMQIDRLETNRLRITGWSGDEALLDNIIAALRTQLQWIKDVS